MIKKLCITMVMGVVIGFSINQTVMSASSIDFTKSEVENGQQKSSSHWYYEETYGSVGYYETSCNDSLVYTRAFHGGTIDMYCESSLDLIVTEFNIPTGPNQPYCAQTATGYTSTGQPGYKYVDPTSTTVGTSIVTGTHRGGYNDHGVVFGC